MRNATVEKVIPLNFRFEYLFGKTGQEHSMVAMISNISSMEKSVPLLTQDDSDMEFCNAENLPPHCDTESVCHCSHMIELNLCKVYEFYLTDGGRKWIQNYFYKCNLALIFKYQFFF